MTTNDLFDAIDRAHKAADVLRAAGWIISFGERDRIYLSASFHGEPPGPVEREKALRVACGGTGTENKGPE